jgi:hypothetical protein
MAQTQGGISRRMKALFLLVGVGIIIGVLVAYQLISLLYVVATLSLVTLLIIVAFADLENVGTQGFGAKQE